MPVSRRFVDRGETVEYGGREWEISRRFVLAGDVVLVVESEGGALALVTRGGEVKAVHPAAPGTVERVSDAVASLLYGARDGRAGSAGEG